MTNRPVGDKAAAWNLMGSAFWELGRSSARPSDAESRMFAQDITPGSRCAVVGASTKGLIEYLLERGMTVTVFDFSARMCADLRAALAPDSCDIAVLDITGHMPAPLRETQDVVLSDRLLNRFVESEARAALQGMLGLVRDGGLVRMSVKLGLYEMDRRMIAAGRERGCLNSFFDQEHIVIDFASAGSVLTDCLMPHGSIPRDVLLEWYRKRGKEKRYSDRDVRDLASSALHSSRSLCLQRVVELPDAASTRLYEMAASRDDSDGRTPCAAS